MGEDTLPLHFQREDLDNDGWIDIDVVDLQDTIAYSLPPDATKCCLGAQSAVQMQQHWRQCWHQHQLAMSKPHLCTGTRMQSTVGSGCECFLALSKHGSEQKHQEQQVLMYFCAHYSKC